MTFWASVAAVFLGTLFSQLVIAAVFALLQLRRLRLKCGDCGERIKMPDMKPLCPSCLRERGIGAFRTPDDLSDPESN